MKSYLVETSVIIDYLRGKPEAVNLLNNLKGDLYSSYICLAELYEGVFRVKNKEEMKEVIDKFFASLSSTFGVDENIAKKFGEIRADLKRRGQIIEDFDLMLAATCLANDLTLISFNQKHFSRVKDLDIY